MFTFFNIPLYLWVELLKTYQNVKCEHLIPYTRHTVSRRSYPKHFVWTKNRRIPIRTWASLVEVFCNGSQTSISKNPLPDFDDGNLEYMFAIVCSKIGHKYEMHFVTLNLKMLSRFSTSNWKLWFAQSSITEERTSQKHCVEFLISLQLTMLMISLKLNHEKWNSNQSYPLEDQNWWILSAAKNSCHFDSIVNHDNCSSNAETEKKKLTARQTHKQPKTLCYSNTICKHFALKHWVKSMTCSYLGLNQPQTSFNNERIYSSHAKSVSHDSHWLFT